MPPQSLNQSATRDPASEANRFNALMKSSMVKQPNKAKALNDGKTQDPATTLGDDVISRRNN